MKISAFIGILVAFLSCSFFEQDDSNRMSKDDNAKEIIKDGLDSVLTEDLPKDSSANMEFNGLSFLALGDSYTIGESVGEQERWPVQLVSKLATDSILVPNLKIIARTGWTTDELQAGIDKEKLSTQYDMVSLLIGVNNQYRGYPINQYSLEFKSLLLQSIRFAGGNKSKVFVLSIPDYGVTPFGLSKGDSDISSEIDEYNTIASNIAKEHGVVYFNITEISRKAQTDLSLLATDKLHPSGKMYAEWVDLIYPWVRTQLRD